VVDVGANAVVISGALSLLDMPAESALVFYTIRPADFVTL